MKIAKRLLMRINGLIRNKVFTQRRLTRLLFNVDMVVSPGVQSYCEWGTIHQRFIMNRYIRPGVRILDIGTGAHAVLAIFAKKHFPNVSVLATDILPERISFARKTVARNGVNVLCLVADMFEGIEGRFDLILFYPPAIPSLELKELGFELKNYPGLGSRRCWSGDGGSDGLDMIRAFLNGVGGHLATEGRAMVSINPSHCCVARFRELCQKAGLKIERIHRLPWISNVYILTARQP